MKRQCDNVVEYNDQCKTRKIQASTIHTNCSSGVTQFKDLSNEIIYEIFEYLDYYYISQAFSNLNKHFEKLINNSKFFIHIDNSFVSISNFKFYYTNIILPNINRIKTLRVTTLFSMNIALLSIENLSKLIQLETLILDNVELSYLNNLSYLKILPKLISLIINNNDYACNKTEIYHQIFQLPILKYCRISLEEKYIPSTFSFTTNIYSSIEHLIINNIIHIDLLYCILLYAPQLYHLSIHGLFGADKKRNDILNRLVHISIRSCCLSFENFELLAKNIFQNLRILCISSNNDITYLDSYRWQQLILYHIPNLKIFDIQCIYPIVPIYEVMIDKFNSPFWIERQWFFARQYLSAPFQNNAMFYSTKPYRRKTFTLHGIINKKNNFDSVHHLHIKSIRAMINLKNYFPNITKLTFSDNLNTIYDSIGNTLAYIIPLKQITTLVIDYKYFTFIQLIRLLSFTVNIQTLELSFILFDEIDFNKIQRNIDFQLISMTNIVKKLILQTDSSVKRIELLIALFPRLEHLTINGLHTSLVRIVRLLLSKNNHLTRQLSCLCILRMDEVSEKSLKMAIKTKKIRKEYFMKLINRKVYLWW